MSLFLKNFELPGCSLAEQIRDLDPEDISYVTNFTDFVVGPRSSLPANLTDRLGTVVNQNIDRNKSLPRLRDEIQIVDTIDEFNSYIKQNFRNVTPGGFFLGDNGSPPVFTYRINADINEATFVQNALNTILTNVSISTAYSPFDIPFPGSAGNSLQFVTYLGLVMAVYPAFLALYPTFERIRSIRQLHYSNGMRPNVTSFL